MKRPMLYWVVLFILGEVSGKVFQKSITIMFAVGMAVIVCAVPTAFFKENRRLLIVGCIFLCAGMVCFSFAEKKRTLSYMDEYEMVEFRGVVTGVEVSEWETSYIIKATAVNQRNLSIGMKISLEDEYELQPGSRISGKGKVKLFSNATNPGGFDEESYQLGNGIFLRLEEVRVTSIIKPVLSIYKTLYQIKNMISGVYQKLFNEKNASLAGAMVLGDKSSLDKDIKQLYQRNGIAHLIAISGLHIAMIGGLLYQMLRKVSGSYIMAVVFGMAFIILYGMMTGLSGATFRAVVMLIVSMGADVSGRRYDTLTAVAVALLIMLIHNPFQITQAGFLLSFGAIIGIAVVNPVWKTLLKKLPKWMDGFFVSVSVQLVLLPVMLYYFYEVPFYGIFLNLIVVPLMSILLALLILCGMVGSIFLPVGGFFAKAADIIFYIHEMLCKLSEELPFHTICTGRPPVYWIILYYMVLAVFLVAGYQKKLRRMLLCAVIYFGLFGVLFLPSSLTICMFDVGQGDGIYIQTPNRKHILIDGGSSSKQKVGTYVLKNGMKYYGGNVLDVVFVSHLDSDHYSGILELLQDDTVRIRNFFLPEIANPDEEYVELERLAVEKGCQVFYLKRGEELNLDGVTFSCFNPTYQEYKDKNQGSMVLRMSYRDFTMLFTGDMDETIEKEIVNQIDTPITALKVAHHGSATASSEEFLNNITTDIGLISVGEKNRYGHPSDEVLSRLYQYCQKIYLTKEDGAITIETNGKTYRIHSYRQNNRKRQNGKLCP